MFCYIKYKEKILPPLKSSYPGHNDLTLLLGNRSHATCENTLPALGGTLIATSCCSCICFHFPETTTPLTVGNMTVGNIDLPFYLPECLASTRQRPQLSSLKSSGELTAGNRVNSKNLLCSKKESRDQDTFHLTDFHGDENWATSSHSRLIMPHNQE